MIVHINPLDFGCQSSRVRAFAAPWFGYSNYSYASYSTSNSWLRVPSLCIQVILSDNSTGWNIDIYNTNHGSTKFEDTRNADIKLWCSIFSRRSKDPSQRDTQAASIEDYQTMVIVRIWCVLYAFSRGSTMLVGGVRGEERFTSGRIRFTIHTMIGIDDCSEYNVYRYMWRFS